MSSTRRRAILCISLFTSLLCAPALEREASAQPTKTPPTTTTTTDYVEQNVGGDQVVKFTGDELKGPTDGAYGTVIRRPPGVARVGLIRPRMNFVVELLKSVENL
jgi:hypothetical protein